MSKGIIKVLSNFVISAVLLSLSVFISFCNNGSKNETYQDDPQREKRKNEGAESLKQNIGEKFTIGNFLDTSGSSVSLDFTTSEFTIIDFWINECPPCNAEMREFRRLIEGKGEKVSIISISLSSFISWKKLFIDRSERYSFLKDSISNWKHWVVKSSEDPKLHNPFANDRINELKKVLDVSFFPSYFVINREGIIINRPESAVKYLQEKLEL